MLQQLIDQTESKSFDRAEYLISVIQELSLARNLATVIDIVKRAARQLTDSDGSTFILQDNGQCYYVDEEAIAPLWKGKRFPLSICIERIFPRKRYYGTARG